MFYEERVMNGVLMCRSTPDGEWRMATTPHAQSVNALLALSESQRKDVLAFFCLHCGGVQPNGKKCQCCNDE